MANLTLPGNPRYQPRSLKEIMGYDNLYRPVGEVEIANLQVLGEIGVIPADEMSYLTPEVIGQILSITTTEVDAIERKVTKHDIRAWVRKAQEYLGPLGRWVHVPLTSYDALDTARSLMFARAHQEVVYPLTRELALILVELVRKFAQTKQIGRTHGQHALPITVGFWLATILSRVVHNAKMMGMFAACLEGKISGAVGANNAQVGLGISSRCGDKSYEARVLEKLGLRPASISSQILPPEPLAYYLFSTCMLSATLAQFGRDCRNLMRSEIAEIAEPFEQGQVGSSTMAHKRNPLFFENTEGMWIKNVGELTKVLLTMISEHQRDLVGSSVTRDFPIIVVNVVQQLETLLRKKRDGEGKEIPGSEFLRRITVDQASLERNFNANARYVLAEPIYIAMQMAGYAGDAHELVNHRAMPIAQERLISLIEAVYVIAEEDAAVKEALVAIPAELAELLGSPARYVGDAAEQAIKIVWNANEYFGA